ncbi:hypothetical protein G3M52_24845, partial [Escherichia coli]|nr:hypothetical protein [Escherichia coli]
MHSWKKKLVVSQLALACTLAITSQANATTYDTWTYYDNPTTALDWSNMDAPGTVDGNYVNYSGFVYYSGFAPIFPDICYHLTHYRPAAADIPVASDNPVHYADAIRYNAR